MVFVLAAIASLLALVVMRRNRELRAALQATDTQLRLITDAVPALVGYLGNDLRYKYANREYVSWFGKSQSEILGRPIDDVLGASLAKTVRPRLQAALQGESQSYDVQASLPDGTEKHYSASYIPDIDDNGKVRGVVVLGVDISDRKRRESEDAKTREALRSLSEELRRSNAELEHFAYTASHDLKEPLRNIGTYLHLLAKGNTERLESSDRQYLEQAIAGSKRMSTLIDALLRFSQMSLKNPERASFSGEDLLKTSFDSVSAAVLETGAELTHDLFPCLVGDKEQLAQVFQNLLSNALKFQKPGETPRVHVGCVQTPQSWIFSVRDNGIGMDPAQTQRIFDPFVRLNSRTLYPGHGIGLALCRKLVQQHGGSIWVESEMGKGATFYFTLPRPEAMPWSEASNIRAALDY